MEKIQWNLHQMIKHNHVPFSVGEIHIFLNLVCPLGIILTHILWCYMYIHDSVIVKTLLLSPLP